MPLAKTIRTIALAILAAALPLAALAQSYPSRPITVIVVFAAGGPSDTIARLLSEHVGRQFGQQLVVENVAGAGGTTGTERAVNAVPDGYTILTHHSGLTAAPALYSNLKFDPRTALEPMGLINTGPMVVLSRKILETKTLAELVAWLKEKGSNATIGFAGVGSNSFVCATVLQQLIGVKLAMVPYRGTGPAMTDLVGGHIQMFFDLLPGSLPQISTGKVRAIANAGAKRPAALPDLPTVAEQGLAGFDSSSWVALVAPAKTPAPVLAKLRAEVAKAVASPDIVARLRELGSEPGTATEKDVRAFMDGEAKKWAEVIRISGAKAD
jgi:tripartite-type tricarboxylate transporter receptor subunit TctC